MIVSFRPIFSHLVAAKVPHPFSPEVYQGILVCLHTAGICSKLFGQTGQRGLFTAVPVIVLIVYHRSVVSFASPATLTVCNLLFPVGTGYTNIASGHLPAPSSGIEIIGVIQRQSSIAEDVYLFIRSAVLIFASLLKLNNFRLSRRMCVKGVM